MATTSRLVIFQDGQLCIIDNCYFFQVVQEGQSVLIFCSSRKGCESTARHVAKFLKSFTVDIKENDCEFADITSAINSLRKCPAGLDPILEETLPAGVAFHHAGLTVFPFSWCCDFHLHIYNYKLFLGVEVHIFSWWKKLELLCFTVVLIGWGTRNCWNLLPERPFTGLNSHIDASSWS